MPQSPATLPAFIGPELRTAARPRALTKGERLFTQGAAVDAIFFVQTGRVKAVRALNDGTQAIMLQSSAGEFFAESALASKVYGCDAFASQVSTVLALPAEAVHLELATNAQFAKSFALAMAGNARRQCSRFERVRLKRARDRVLHLLTCESDPHNRYHLTTPLVELAEELALEPETLYRVLSELVNEGRILRTRAYFELLG
ncbi:MAG: Crp/Fnr family transcriptional regulator [Thiotrichales bacterium]